MRELHVDIESFSRVSLTKCGVHKYAECPELGLTLFQWAEDDGPVRAVSPLQIEEIPPHVLDALTDPKVLKTGWNIAFERTVLAAVLGVPMPAEQWECTMVLAATLGLPLDLDRAGRALKIKTPKQGSSAMRYFCIPCKPTAANGMRTRNLPHHDPEKWADFVEYGITDVKAEVEILQRCRKIAVDPEVAATERAMWILDQRVNDRGVRVDLTLAENAVQLNEAFKARCFAEAKDLTGLDNPNSVAQLKGWLLQAEGLAVEELNKKIVPQLLKDSDSETLTRVLQLRQEMSKTSVQKYSAMQNRACADGFFRGGAQFYGANRTGRWAHRGVQLGNLPHNKVADILEARAMLRRGDTETLEALWGVPSFILSQLIRTAFIPDDDDSEFLVVDFSAIEARMLAWCADEQWRLDVFNGDGLIYEHSASRAFGVPWSEFQDYIDRGKKHPLRFKGKVQELACLQYDTMVLTDRGEIPLASVTTDMRLWDGVEWVNHGGLIDRGEKDVIEYAGLCATPDHVVWTTEGPTQFGIAAKGRQRLVQSGAGGAPVRVGNNRVFGTPVHSGVGGRVCEDPVPRVPSDELAEPVEFNAGPLERVPGVLSTASDTAATGPRIDRCEATVHESGRQELQELRRSGDRVSVRLGDDGGSVDRREPRAQSGQTPTGSSGQQRPLRGGEPAVGDVDATSAEHQENQTFRRVGTREVALCVQPGDPALESGDDERSDPSGRLGGCHRETKKLASDQGKTRKARVYDILNAGPRNRFTAGGFLVHNCGYQGGEGALVRMGALEEGLTLPELRPIVDAWRDASQMIAGASYKGQTPGLWELMDTAALKAVRTGRPAEVKHGIEFSVDKGILFVRLPSGRKLAYMQPRVAEGKFGNDCVEYSGLDQLTNQWVRIQSYGGKWTENLCQAASRDVLRDKLLRLDELPTYRDALRFTVHDEAVYSVKRGVGSVAEIEEIFAEPLPWAPGLPLAGAGFAAPCYMKEVD